MAGIYVHIPFCASKCVYCGFYSVVSTARREEYLTALAREMSLRQDYLGGADIRTLYLGGGTPTLLTPDELASLLADLRRHFPIVPDAEITLEGNPEQLTEAYCRELHTLGVNRLSIGVQSFHDHVLRFMGRRHTAAEAMEAVHNAAAAGIHNLSIDLIYGVSERTDEQWADELRHLPELPITHFSAYALTPEENSLLYKQIQHGRHAPVDEEMATRQYAMLTDFAREHGFEHYEVSNFARQGFHSHHNSAYWDGTPYLGLGAAAHSFDGTSRQWNAGNLNQYLRDIADGQTCAEKETLSPANLYNETLLLRLRTRVGLDLDALQARFGPQRRQELLSYFEKEVPSEHYELTKNRLCLTEAGLWFADGIAGNAFI
ncbi:MAG: radical SAM family heme chaperone HemW [Bacteroidales bacterium]|nr:radical SAM family heme chaperone HemW [Bacteroidales bacterium]